MTTNDRIWSMISNKPMTRFQISRRMGISPKTVSNRLAEIHDEISSRSSKRSRGNRYVVLERGSSRWFGIAPASKAKKTFTLGRHKFNKDRKAIYMGALPAEVYSA